MFLYQQHLLDNSSFSSHDMYVPFIVESNQAIKHGIVGIKSKVTLITAVIVQVFEHSFANAIFDFQDT